MNVSPLAAEPATYAVLQVVIAKRKRPSLSRELSQVGLTIRERLLHAVAGQLSGVATFDREWSEAPARHAAP